MARDVTVSVEATLTGISIDPINRRVIVDGVWREVNQTRPLRSFSEDVTDLLTDNQRTLIAGLVTRAQTWLDNQTG